MRGESDAIIWVFCTDEPGSPEGPHGKLIKPSWSFTIGYAAMVLCLRGSRLEIPPDFLHPLI